MLKMYLEDAPMVAHEGCGVRAYSLWHSGSNTTLDIGAGTHTLGRAKFLQYLGVNSTWCSKTQMQLVVDPARSTIELTSLGSVPTFVSNRGGAETQLTKQTRAKRVRDGCSIGVRCGDGTWAMQLTVVDTYDLVGFARRLGVQIPREHRVGEVHELGGANPAGRGEGQGGGAHRPRLAVASSAVASVLHTTQDQMDSPSQVF